MSTCATCGAEGASHDTLVDKLKLCDDCYARRVIGTPSSVYRCETCKRTGKVSCSACGGSGGRECNTGCKHECLNCNGTGEVKCPECDGAHNACQKRRAA